MRTEGPEASKKTNGFSPDSTCGVSKGCFKSYECGSGDCTYLVTWYRSGDQMKFEFTSTITGSSKYLCLGFSDDDDMGDDSTIACKYVSGGVSVEGGYNVEETYTILSTPLEKISNVVTSATGSTFTCTFDRQINSTNTKIFDLNTHWYLFLAEGFITDGVLQEHYARKPPKSEDVVDMFAFEVIIGDPLNEKTAKLHGVLMVLTWMIFSSVGLVIARYFKSEWSDKTILGQKIWFQVHRACMVLVLLLTVISFFIIILSAEGYRDNLESSDKKHLNSHPILGIVILILTCINPIMSFFRCSPDDNRRKYFNWAHFIVGVSAHILAVINIIFGLQLTKSGVKIGAVYVMYVYIAVYVLFEVFFEILKMSERSQVQDNKYDMNMKRLEDTNSQDNPDRNQKFTRMRRILLIAHLISLGILSLTVIVYILLDIGK
ncbi:putative ferric-chelate reductase 1 isoform X2 [Ostrea edulis]|uniref:putative ferric-chelate reductase 1 isoform X2 n=1 Tax=Ostrea edulis TaxID=37623 RepID=UPI002095B67C|nr:putative ferric-chelate reductase 1 isoform X2 [Ostrea edulis]XP_048766048.1 putative ferric-chelate reductase 1 isoform X2 [Ostrea edulis]